MTAISSQVLAQIEGIVGSDNLTSRPEDLHCYSYDGMGRSCLPEVVVFPHDTTQVSDLMKLASTHRIPVTPRGAGTGMTGGVVPVRGGIVMAMNKFDAIVEIDSGNQVAIVEPGVITAEFQREVRKHGLFYPVDPASMNYCSIGGNAAECAGGPSAVKYGVTKDYIMGLEVVLSTGEIITTGARTEKSVAGYDLTRLFVGSEGTLGIITKLIVRLLPVPAYKETFLLTSTSLRRTTEMVSEILNNNIKPCTLEYMDKTAIQTVAGYLSNPLPPETEALLIVEIDGEQQEVAGQAALFRSFVEDRDGFALRQATNEQEVAEIWQARRAVAPSSLKLRPSKIGEDVVVPRSRIPELVEFIEQLAERQQLIILTFGHAGDGNIHVNILYDKSVAGEMERVKTAVDELFKQTVGLGGTLSGEHGIGLSKKSYMPYEFNQDTLNLMGKIKDLLDPNHILNPEKILPS